MSVTTEQKHTISLTLKGWLGSPEGRPGAQILPGDVMRALATDIHAPVEIQFNMLGGLVRTGWEIFEIIQAHKGPTTARAQSQCDSAGLIPYLACDHRACVSWTSFLLHHVRMWPCDFTADHYTATNLREIAFEMDDHDARMLALLSERTSERSAFWRDRLLPDPGWHITAVEAVSSGLAHWIET
jgi:ATP-dependent protease ClpP protease subunit